MFPIEQVASASAQPLSRQVAPSAWDRRERGWSFRGACWPPPRVCSGAPHSTLLDNRVVANNDWAGWPAAIRAHFLKRKRDRALHKRMFGHDCFAHLGTPDISAVERCLT